MKGEAIKDFHVTVRVRNNQLYERRTDMGMTQAQVAEGAGITPSTYSAFECMSLKPFDRHGELKKTARGIAIFLSESAEVLWPDDVLAIIKSHTSRKMGCADMKEMMGAYSQHAALSPDNLYDEKERENAARIAVMTLDDRERNILDRRYGLSGKDCETYIDIAATVTNQHGDPSISVARVSQIEDRALRKLRHSTASKHLKGAIK